jgi:hypothetical protein
VVAKSKRPSTVFRGRRIGFEDAADNSAVWQHVVIVEACY